VSQYEFLLINRRTIRLRAPVRSLFPIFLFLLAIPMLSGALAEPPLNGSEVMRRVNARPRSDSTRMHLDMMLRGQRGEFQKRVVIERKRLDGGYRTVYWILAPEHENGLGLLLSEDPPQHGMWMYFPATRQVVHVVSQGLPAFASDFSCADLLTSVPSSDYEFRLLGDEPQNRIPVVRVEMKPRDERLRSELGFANSIGWVRTDIWMIIRADYFDNHGETFKSFRAEDVAQVQGVWTARKLTMENYRARHSTEVRVTDVNYSLQLGSDAFTLGRFGSGLISPVE
jgi:hypothetical protein